MAKLKLMKKLVNTLKIQTFNCKAKIEIEEKTRQNAKSKQTFDFTAKIEIEEKKFVKTLLINKL